MNRTVGIRLGERSIPVGLLRYDRQGARESAAFEYTRDWLESKERYALDPALPCVGGSQFRRSAGGRSIFPAVLADTEPDGWGRRVIQRDHAKRRVEARRSGTAMVNRPLDSLDYLLAVDDFSRIGAIRLVDENSVFQRNAGDGLRRTPPLVELGQLLAATRAVETDNETGADLAYLLGRATSLGDCARSAPYSMTTVRSPSASSRASATNVRWYAERCLPCSSPVPPASTPRRRA